MTTPPTFISGAILTAANMNSVGLWLTKAQTIGSAVSSVAVTGAFSADYDNYKILVSGGVGTIDGSLQMQLGSTVTGYYYGANGATFAGVGDPAGAVNAARWENVGRGGPNGLSMSIELQNPFLANNTFGQWTWTVNSTSGRTRVAGGYLNNTTSYTGFTLIAESGTWTGGTIAVYGYKGTV